MQANEDELQKALNDITSPAPATDEVTAPTVDASETAASIATPADFAANPATISTETAAPAMEIPDIPAPPAPEPPSMPEFTVPTPEPAAPAAPEVQVPPIETYTPANVNSANLEGVKSNILKDLAPLMDKIQIEPEKKFEIYSDMMEENNDATVVAPAYDAARQISDETKRGEALLALFEKIEQFEH